MDPISASGIGLSVASLCLQVFAGCVKGFALLNDATNMPSRYQYLRTRLCLEQGRLLNWGEQVGLLEEMLEQPSQALRLSHNIVLDVLFEMQAAFRDCLKITSNYDSFVVGTSSVLLGATSKQYVFLQKARGCWGGVKGVGPRLQWAMVKGDAFEVLIVRIVAFNNRMEGLLDRSAISDLHLMQEKSNLLLLQLTQQVSELTDLARGSNILLEQPSPRSESFSRSSTLGSSESGQMSHLATLANFKAHVIDLTQTSKVRSKDSKLGLDAVRVGYDVRETGRISATVSGQSAWIEWRTLLENKPTPAFAALVESRLSDLASLLSAPDKPAGFRTAQCLGYFRDEVGDEIRYGLVYRAPTTSTTPIINVRTLRRHFQQSRSPSLSIRAALATTIVESVLYLHAVNWLHKGLQSDNILFFLAEDRFLNDSDLLNPVISGFDFSRPDESDQTTIKSTSKLQDDYYRHPDLLQFSSIRSSKTYDIYALGIILVEIALWKPIEAIMEVCFAKKVTRSVCPRIRERLLAGPYGDFENVLSAVSAQAGDTYASATKRCLEGGTALGMEPRSNQEDPQVSGKLQEVFYDEVFLKLKSIHT